MTSARPLPSFADVGGYTSPARRRSAPRRLPSHRAGPYVYVLNELDSTIAIEPSGTLLSAANMDSDTIVASHVHADTGRLTPTGHVVETGSPSSIVFR